MLSNSTGNLFKTSLITLLLVSLFGLQACGLPEEQGGSDGSTGNIDDSSEDAVTDNDISLGKTIIINAERINGETDISLGDVSFVSLSPSFAEITDGSLPEWEVVRSDTTGNIELYLESDYVERINHVVKLDFGRGETYYASIPYVPSELNTTKQVTVNIFSHYLLKKLFDQIPDSDSLKVLQPCTTNDPSIGCEHQPRAKQDYLAMVNDMVSQYSFGLSTTLTVSTALNAIETIDEARRQVESALTEITRETSPFAKGTVREVTGFGIDSTGNAYTTPPPDSKTYNSAFFALSLSELNPANTQESVIVAASNSTIIGNKELANELPAYPQYKHTTYVNELRRDSALFVDIPYERTTLTINDIDNAELDRTEPTNAYASLTTPDSFLSRQGQLLEGRVLSQTIPGGVSDAKDIGWEYQPVFTKLYHANEYEPDSLFITGQETDEIDYGAEPTWLTAANFSRAATFQLDTSNIRGDRIEGVNLFSWEVHALQTPSTFTSSALNGKKYGVISFAQKLNDSDSSSTVELFGETMNWNANAGIFSLSQSLSNPHYRSYTLSREADNSIQALQERLSIIESTRSYFTEASEVASATEPSGIATKNLGIMKLDGGSEAPIGHISENGSYFAFTFNTSDTSTTTDRGNGIIIGMELEDIVSPVFPDLDDDSQFIYQLQGNSFTILGESNTLQNLNGSTLQITDRLASEPDSNTHCHATLNLSRLSVSHTLNEQKNSLSDIEIDSQTGLESSGCTINQSETEITYDNVFGQALTLKGFISRSGDGDTKDVPGNLLSLLWLQDNTVGLIFAGKNQNLKANFD
jgi:hypothetical protein